MKNLRKSEKKRLKDKVWKVFSLYIRTKFAKNGIVACYTCDKQMPIHLSQAGHAIGGRTNSVLFDEEIVRPQCRRCNIFLGGNYPVFVTKLIKENGLEWWEKKLRDSKKVKKFTVSELKDLLEYYTKKLERLNETKKSAP